MPQVLILGDGGVGKSSLFKRRFTRIFDSRYNSTYGIQIMYDGEYVIYDFPGQEKYGEHDDVDFSRIDNCIIMYDCGNTISYKNIEFWKKKLKKICPNIQPLIVGNKMDLSRRKIVDDESINISVKTGENIDKVFQSLI